MSNWTRSYHGNGNQNGGYYRTQQNQPNPSLSAEGSWPMHHNEQQQNNEMTRTYSHDEQRRTNGSFGNEYNADLVQLCNGFLDKDILERAANSNLVATAGEFVPSGQYSYYYAQQPIESVEMNSNANSAQDFSEPRQSSSNFSPNPSTSYNQSNNFYQQQHAPNQRTYNSRQDRSFYNSKEFQRNGKSREKNRNSYQHAGSGRSFDRGSGSNQPSQSNDSLMEECKSEGRKNLLEEAAAILSATNSARFNGNSTDSTNTELTMSGGNSSKSQMRRKQNSHKGPDQYFNRNSKSSGQDNYYNGANFKKDNTSYSTTSEDHQVSQRDRLIEQLNRGILECLVCYDRVRQHDAVWNCANCYHVLHLRCIIKWAQSSRAENGWRCPACQNVTDKVPQIYVCFCGQLTDPEWNRNDTAHSCGEVCNKSKPNTSEFFECQHRCTLLCHPGPCPPCVAMVDRKCGCGKTSQIVRCGQNTKTLSCGSECAKPLSCNAHFCTKICHLGECEPCQVIVSQVCYCGAENREVPCDVKTFNVLNYECGGVCQRKFDCNEHPCRELCHPGSCGSCPLDPVNISHCPCGKMKLDDNVKRTSCLDPVPTCSAVCEKQLKCGQPSSPHTCKSLCHEGACPPCELSTLVRCRCGNMDKETPCQSLTTKADEALCQRKCTKKRRCGKHKCNQLCCIEVDHICPLPCNHVLTCGQHRCEALCHKGYCQPCWRASFEELFCECGKTVRYPPVPCGAKRPTCDEPCSRQHSCDHAVLHNCHNDPECPPCIVLTSKYCYGKHELRKAVPCHVEEFSCGLPCGKDLPCGRHKCITSCHKGECLKPDQACVQPCTIPRSICGHPCNSPCHDGDCPDTLCKVKITVTCACGHRSTSRTCCENNKEYQRIATSILASKMAEVQLGKSIDLQDMQKVHKLSLKTLECIEECRVIDRQRKLSIGLQIRNPDLTAKLTPRYSDFMRSWGKKDPRFCKHVHDRLTELVQLAKQSKQKSRSYSFETMNRDKRQFVHEYCEHFGCESVAYDAEPKRNIVATAQRDKAWLPSYSLLEVLQRESGQRKVPVPTMNMKKGLVQLSGPSSASAWSTGMVPVKLSGTNNSSSSDSSKQQTPASSSSTYDYFD